MRKSSWILLGGMSLAAVVFVGASLAHRHHRTEETEFIAACKREANDPSGDEFQKYLVCRPEALRSLEGEDAAVGIQAKILSAHEAATAAKKWNVAAAVVALLSAVPWFWYFLLRRIGELRAAIAGNPPEG